MMEPVGFCYAKPCEVGTIINKLIATRGADDMAHELTLKEAYL